MQARTTDGESTLGVLQKLFEGAALLGASSSISGSTRGLDVSHCLEVMRSRVMQTTPVPAQKKIAPKGKGRYGRGAGREARPEIVVAGAGSGTQLSALLRPVKQVYLYELVVSLMSNKVLPRGWNKVSLVCLHDKRHKEKPTDPQTA